MKKLKRLTAVLLAAVMALAMLTACGGGGGSRSEKERYIAGINSYLGKRITNFQKLTYDSDTDGALKDYRDVYEAMKANHNEDEAKRLAKNAAHFDDVNYRVFQLEIDTKSKETEKINDVADAILKGVKSSELENNRWSVNYIWSKEETKKNKKMIYIVLHLEETLTGNAE